MIKYNKALFDNLFHFLVDSGYPIHVRTQDLRNFPSELFEAKLTTKFKDRPFQITSLGIPSEITARFWKKMYELEVNEYRELHDAVKAVVNKF